jgi:hypothetical protein
MSTERRWTVRVADGPPKDRSFDLEFWQSVSARERWEAAWQMIVDAHAIRGDDEHQLRLQRTVISSRPASG